MGVWVVIKVFRDRVKRGKPRFDRDELVTPQTSPGSGLKYFRRLREKKNPRSWPLGPGSKIIKFLLVKIIQQISKINSHRHFCFSRGINTVMGAPAGALHRNKRRLKLICVLDLITKATALPRNEFSFQLPRNQFSRNEYYPPKGYASAYPVGVQFFLLPHYLD